MLAALSLTTDLAAGMPFEKGLRVCLVADGIARELGLGEAEGADVYSASLLRSVGCTAHASENAAGFGDDLVFQRVLKTLDVGDPDVLAGQLQELGGPAMAQHFLEVAPTEGPVATAAGCEVSRALAPRMLASPATVAALDDVYERWDGRGLPLGREGAEISLVGRVLHVAEQAVLASPTNDADAAAEEVRRRAGGHLDPEVAAAFVTHARELFGALDADDLLGAVLEREPQPRRTMSRTELLQMCAALGVVADLKSVHLLGHSNHVAGLARAAGARHGLPEEALDRITAAALLHNLGCVVVPGNLLDRTGPLGAAALERLRLQGHWTARILERCPSLAELADLARPASEHHAALAEGRYTTWGSTPGRERPTSAPARLLEAAEAFASYLEPRPGRPGLDRASAAAGVREAARDGRLDPDAVACVLDDGGLAPRHPSTKLTAREVQVLALAARGLSNRDIAERLHIAERTVGHHLAHVYDKTGRRTRAGVAVWAIEQGLLPRVAEQ